MPESSREMAVMRENAREAVRQHCDGRDAEQRAMNRADAAEDARAAEHDGGDGGEFVADARIRPRLGDARDENDRGQPRDRARERVGERDAALRPECPRNARPPARSRWRGTSARTWSDARAAKCRSRRHEKDPRLHRHAEEERIAQREKRIGEIRVRLSCRR